MFRRSGIPKADLVSAVLLVALCSATIVQLLRIRSSVFDVDPAAAPADATLLIDDLQRTTAAGLLHASANEIELRVRTAAGVVCAADERTTAIAALPAMLPEHFELAAISTIGWRDANGRYTYADTELQQPPHVGGSACAAAGIELPPGAMILNVASADRTPPVGSTAVLFSRIAYRLRPAGESARSELWRAAGGSERRIATLSSDAAFRFYVDAARTPAPDVPAPITRVRGIELHLPGTSDVEPLPGAVFLQPGP